MNFREKKRVNVELDAELHRYLRMAAASKNQNLSEILSDVIISHKDKSVVGVLKNDQQ